MSSPGQTRGTCSHVMALFDGREKGVGDRLKDGWLEDGLSDLQSVYACTNSTTFRPYLRVQEITRSEEDCN